MRSAIGETRNDRGDRACLARSAEAHRSAYRRRRRRGAPVLAERTASPMIVLGTAHPAKFPAAIEAAVGINPPLPPHLADIFLRKEHFDVLPNDQGETRNLYAAMPPCARKGRRHERRDHDFAIRPADRHRSHGASRDRVARRLGGRRIAPRTAARTRPFASSRTYGVQGYAAALGARHRRGDRNCGRRSQRRDKRRANSLLCACACRRVPASRSIFSPIF